MKKLILSFVLGALTAIGFSGCEKEIKTTEYFKTHSKERKEKLVECEKAQTLTESERKECQNAFYAQQFGGEE